MTRRQGVLLLLAVILGLSFAMRALLFAGLWDPDDFLYARYANDLRIGTFAVADWYAPRLAVFVPVAPAFAGLGVSDFSACLWPMLAATGGLVALFAILFRLYGVVPALAGCALLATSPGYAFRGNALRPDIVVTFGVLGAIAALLEADARERTRERLPWLALSALLALVGHLGRELALPMLALFAAIYLFVRRLRPDHLWIPALVLAGLALEAAWHASMSGDPFFRFKVFGWYASTKPEYPLRLGFYAEPLLIDLSRGWASSPWAWALPVGLIASACVRARRVPGLLLGFLAAGWLLVEFTATSFFPFRPFFKEPRFAVQLLPLLHASLGWALAVWWLPRPARLAAERSARGRLELTAGFASAALFAALLAGGVANALWPPQQAVLKQFTTDPRVLALEQQPLREMAAVLTRLPPRRTLVPQGIEGARLARALAFYMGYPTNGLRDASALVPGSGFEPSEGRAALRNATDVYLLRWVQASAPGTTRPPPGWAELYRTQGSPALALFAPEAPLR